MKVVPVACVDCVRWPVRVIPRPCFVEFPMGSYSAWQILVITPCRDKRDDLPYDFRVSRGNMIEKFPLLAAQTPLIR
jgi:hypothetical protein